VHAARAGGGERKPSKKGNRTCARSLLRVARTLSDSETARARGWRGERPWSPEFSPSSSHLSASG
jgi:hypothetical protein